MMDIHALHHEDARETMAGFSHHDEEDHPCPAMLQESLAQLNYAVSAPLPPTAQKDAMIFPFCPVSYLGVQVSKAMSIC